MKPTASRRFLTGLVCSILTLSVAAGGPSQHDRLAPAVTTYLELLLCANTAQEFQQNEVSAQAFRDMAFKVEDAIMAAGWSDDAMNSTIIARQESYTELELNDGDTRESWQLRHFSGDRCQRQMVAGGNYLADGLPLPR